MEAALRGIRAKLTEHREKVISALLLSSFVVLGWRSSEHQREIESLLAEKRSLRATNSSMSAAMWAWREELFSLAAAPSSPISLSRLRHIYGEEEPRAARVQAARIRCWGGIGHYSLNSFTPFSMQHAVYSMAGFLKARML